MPSAAELRALADATEVMEGKERNLHEAKAAFTNDPSDENREKLRKAIDEMAAVRTDLRSSSITAIASEPGSQTIIPNAVATVAPQAAPVVTQDQEG